MIIYGVSKKLLKTEHIEEMCPDCSTGSTLEMTIFQKYFHIFWIPFFPFEKDVIVKCPACDHRLDIFSLSQNAQNLYLHIKSGIKSPTYLFSGIVLCLMIGVFLIFRVIEHKSRIQEFLTSPDSGDIYEIRLEDGCFTLARVMRAANDSIYLSYHLYTTADQYYLNQLKREKQFGEEIYIYFKSELLELYDLGIILDAEHGVPPENFIFIANEENAFSEAEPQPGPVESILFDSVDSRSNKAPGSAAKK